MCAASLPGHGVVAGWTSELRTRQELADARETITAYEAGAVGLWTAALRDGAGLGEEVAGCVAEEMVASNGPATLEVFEAFAVSPAAMPPAEFMSRFIGAWGACGLDIADLVG